MRHSRIDAWRASGAMMLLRGRGESQPRPAHRGTIVHLHARYALSPLVTLSLRPAMAKPVVLRRAAGEPAVRREALPVATAHAVTPDRHDAASSAAAPAAVRALVSPAWRPAPAQHARPPAAAPDPAAREQRIAWPAAVHASEVVKRVRRNASRRETTPPAMAAVLASRDRDAARAAAGERHVDAPSAPSQHGGFDGAQRLQRAPAFDVEALTGLVIQQLDRRLVAYRERMGRA